MATAAELKLLDSDEINPDRNKTNLLSASFYRGEDGNDYCRIINMHDQGKNDLSQLVNPSHVRRWPALWKAYQHGRDRAAPAGTSLRKVIGLDESSVLVLKLHQIQTAEALTAADDALLLAVLGENGLQMRASAKQMLRAQQADALEAQLKSANASSHDEPAIPDVSSEADAIIAAEFARQAEQQAPQAGRNARGR